MSKNILSPFLKVPPIESKKRIWTRYTNCPPGQRFYRCRYVVETHPGNHSTRNVGSMAGLYCQQFPLRTPLPMARWPTSDYKISQRAHDRWTFAIHTCAGRPIVRIQIVLALDRLKNEPISWRQSIVIDIFVYALIIFKFTIRDTIRRVNYIFWHRLKIYPRRKGFVSPHDCNTVSVRLREQYNLSRVFLSFSYTLRDRI